MSWTTPRTWVAGETVTAAMLNTHLRDNLNAFTPLGDPTVATTYPVTLSATTTNPTLGTGGSTIGKYSQVGKQVSGSGLITFGSAGANAGSGTYQINLPTAVDPYLGVGQIVGGFTARCAGAFTRGDLYLTNGAGVCRFVYTSAAVGGSSIAANNTTPGVWTNNDTIQFYLDYFTP